MDFEGIKNFEFFISLGYVTITASILTMIFTQIIKMILKKRKIIYPGMEANEKDAILSKAGRIVAIILYSSLYIGNEYYLKHQIIFDGALLTGILSGGALTLTIAKGLYTTIRQYQKKSNVFERLKMAEKTIKQLNQSNQTNNLTDEEQTKEIFENVNTQIRLKTWKLSNKND